jgi:type I restriction enzyme S subunit
MSGSTQQYITLGSLREFPIILPPDDIMSHFYEIVEPQITLMNINNIESSSLQQIRDTLLPKLISGELLPSDLQQIENSL